jgi:PAS domain S-box-containing protein
VLRPPERWAAIESSLRDASPDAVVVLDARCRVREWNASAERIFGYRSSKALGCSIASLIIPGAERVLKEDFARYLKTGASDYVGQVREVPSVRSDGLEITVELLALPIPGPAPEFLLQMRDITERKREIAAYVDFYRKMQAYHQGAARTMAALTHDLDIAHAIQRAALPVAAPSLPGWDIALRYEFAHEVGGDFCIFVEDEQRLNVVVGDVSGKGVPAALTSTSITHLLPWLLSTHSPHAALVDLNKDLKALLPTEEFATLVVAEVNPVSRRVSLWNAGHPAAIRWSARTARISRSRVGNPLLGVLAEWDGSAESWSLEDGDVIVLCTDGNLEARGADEVQFGLDQCAGVIAGNASLSAAGIAEALLEEVHLWGELGDDVTIVVLKCLPAG